MRLVKTPTGGQTKQSTTISGLFGYFNVESTQNAKLNTHSAIANTSREVTGDPSNSNRMRKINKLKYHFLRPT